MVRALDAIHSSCFVGGLEEGGGGYSSGSGSGSAGTSADRALLSAMKRASSFEEVLQSDPSGKTAVQITWTNLNFASTVTS